MLKTVLLLSVLAVAAFADTDALWKQYKVSSHFLPWNIIANSCFN